MCRNSTIIHLLNERIKSFMSPKKKIHVEDCFHATCNFLGFGTVFRQKKPGKIRQNLAKLCYCEFSFTKYEFFYQVWNLFLEKSRRELKMLNNVGYCVKKISCGCPENLFLFLISHFYFVTLQHHQGWTHSQCLKIT